MIMLLLNNRNSSINTKTLYSRRQEGDSSTDISTRKPSGGTEFVTSYFSKTGNCSREIGSANRRRGLSSRSLRSYVDTNNFNPIFNYTSERNWLKIEKLKLLMNYLTYHVSPVMYLKVVNLIT